MPDLLSAQCSLHDFHSVFLLVGNLFTVLLMLLEMKNFACSGSHDCYLIHYSQRFPFHWLQMKLSEKLAVILQPGENESQDWDKMDVSVKNLPFDAKEEGVTLSDPCFS